uniref:C2H2-type domain-containing protein n=1 Tax=Xiphophorus maculatus TaxID=8083 RepID=A0A3B5QC77_XIPMA
AAALHRPLAPSEPEPDSAPDSGPDLQQVKLEPDSTVCDVCGKVMKNKSSLARHSFIHTGKKPFACHLCPLRFNRRDNLRHHLGRLHPDGAARRQRQSTAPAWLCAVCGKTFVCRSRLKTHEVLLHPSRSTAEPSPPPDASEMQLTEHARIHVGDNLHRCSVCLRGFQRPGYLRQHHLRVHLRAAAGDAPGGSRRRGASPSSFPCTACGKTFRFRSLLASHALVHGDVRPFACDFCSRSFRRLSHLKRHRRAVHADGARPPQSFVCHICGKDKKCRSQLARHVVIHTGERPFACDLCPARFNRRGNLQQHQRRMHGVGKAGEAPPILFQDEDDAPSYKQEELLDRVGGAGDEDEQLDAT